VWNWIIDVCFCSGKASLATMNRDGHAPLQEVGGTVVNPIGE
jgi:hypothetical protein